MENNSTNWVSVLGRTGSTLQAHRLAKKCMKQGEPITAKDVNKVLAFANIKINQATLDEILKRPRLVFENLDSNTVKSDYFIKNIGKVRSKIKVPGIYIWTHKTTGNKYVGSSSELARRLIGYFNNHYKDTGKLISLLKSEGVSALKLEVIPLTDSYEVHQEHCLEQYFLLHP